MLCKLIHKELCNYAQLVAKSVDNEDAKDQEERSEHDNEALLLLIKICNALIYQSKMVAGNDD